MRGLTSRPNARSALSDEHLERVRIVQPCHGGTWAGKLAKLSNADKHKATVEVLPTLKFKVPATRHTGSTGSSLFLLEVIDPTIDVTIHGYHADGSALHQLEELLVGVVSYLESVLESNGSKRDIGGGTDHRCWLTDSIRRSGSPTEILRR